MHYKRRRHYHRYCCRRRCRRHRHQHYRCRSFLDLHFFKFLLFHVKNKDISQAYIKNKVMLYHIIINFSRSIV